MSRIKLGVTAACTVGRQLLGHGSVIEGETAASTLLGYVWAEEPLGVDAVPEFLEALARKARPGGDVGAYVSLRALARVLPPEQASLATEAADRWSPAQRPDLPWADAPTPTPDQAWLGHNPYGDETTLLLEYAAPTTHSLVAVISQAGGEHIAVMGLFSPESLAAILDDYDYDLSPYDVAEVENTLAQAMLKVDNTWPRPEGDEPYSAWRAFAAARLRLWDRERIWPEWKAMPDAERDALTEEFLTRTHNCKDEDVLRSLVHYFLEYGDGYISRPSPLHWSPAHAEVFLLDWVPRKTLLDDAERTALPGTLIDWCAFALHRAGVDERFVEPVAFTIIELREEFHATYDDPRTWGPAKEIAMGLAADGVSIEDKPAVDAWISQYNAHRLASSLLDPRDD